LFLAGIPFAISPLWKQKQRREEMKRLMFFLMGLGLGLVFIAGDFETSLAEFAEKHAIVLQHQSHNPWERVSVYHESAIGA